MKQTMTKLMIPVLLILATFLPVALFGNSYAFVMLWFTTFMVLFVLLGIPILACMLGVGLAIVYCHITGKYVQEPILKCDRWRCYCYKYDRVKSQDALNQRIQRQLSTGVRFNVGRY